LVNAKSAGVRCTFYHECIPEHVVVSWIRVGLSPRSHLLPAGVVSPGSEADEVLVLFGG